MPPRLPALTSLALQGASIRSPLSALLSPFSQSRSASILGSLSDNPGAYSKRIRVGRGPGSGKGKTSGRGHKGQKQHGSVPAGFQGGQTTPQVVRGIRGFENHFSVDMTTVNLDRIQSWIDQGRLDPSKTITLKELHSSGCLRVKDGVKLLAGGAEKFNTPIDILVSRASTTAIEAVEAAGGKVTTRYYTRPAIKRILQNEAISTPFPFGMQSANVTDEVYSHFLAPPSSKWRPPLKRLPEPTSRKDIEYYRDPAHRGYLSHLVKEGQGPSLFFRTPGTGKGLDEKDMDEQDGALVVASKKRAENRLW